MDPELLAAKMGGRWRNGVPLALSPDTDSPAGEIPAEQMNDFEYVNADRSGDPKGIPGGSSNGYWVIRRGLPYGPIYDPGQPYDGIDRGMLFYFINSNIENQYEFVLRQWVNDSEFAGAVRLNPDSKDPLIGNADPAGSTLVLPRADGNPPIEVKVSQAS